MSCPGVLSGASRVRYAGEPIAGVAAETAYAAEGALAAIMVAYEKLPAVVDQEAAIKEGARAFTTRCRVTLPSDFTVPAAMLRGSSLRPTLSSDGVSPTTA